MLFQYSKSINCNSDSKGVLACSAQRFLKPPAWVRPCGAKNVVRGMGCEFWELHEMGMEEFRLRGPKLFVTVLMERHQAEGQRQFGNEREVGRLRRAGISQLVGDLAFQAASFIEDFGLRLLG